ncbi:cytosol aminopeptidase-like isoform X3 [Amphibalanus amphitrite]|uniref:cytosol aminopeptidase-like isoform X3 n=1 Tax=Amphibalanus amphitrite TaxID=1232801 RepID=UPI001C8FE0BE|nr:cytosol aminopeptidase-like isoform X3 [Amphibalanus amphitrite]
MNESPPRPRCGPGRWLTARSPELREVQSARTVLHQGTRTRHWIGIQVGSYWLRFTHSGFTNKMLLIRHRVPSGLLKFCHQAGVRLSSTAATEKHGLVLGVYKDGDKYTLTEEAGKFNKKTGGRLDELLQCASVTGKLSESRLLFGLTPEFPAVAVVGLGDRHRQDVDHAEDVHAGRENVRTAVAGGVRALREVRCSHVTVEPAGEPEASAEGAHLALWAYDELKAEKSRQKSVELSCTDGDSEPWRRGVHRAAGQNLARTLMEMPANHLTPTLFCQRVSETMAGLPVEVTIRDEAWIRQNNMGAFLSVARGSVEPPRLLELSYSGAASDSAPLAIVGKGVTFDSGGISLKPSNKMDKMRADMGGAACTAGVLYAAARLGLAANLRAFIPLCENMPGGRATKPGDVVTAMSGKTIQVDHTDFEGRLILVDAMWYAQQVCKPRAMLDMATLTYDMVVALGSAAVGVFTNSTAAWRHLRAAGSATGDRVWRMPLWRHYTNYMTDCELADLNNIGTMAGPGMCWPGGACSAAAFLREFVSEDLPWLHLDIAGTMENSADDVRYLPKGMSGRPTRTVLQFAETLCRDERPATD